jgi:cell division transport system ATP-binding protein
MSLLINISKDYNTAVVMASHDYIVVQKFPARMIRTEKGMISDNATISIQ